MTLEFAANNALTNKLYAKRLSVEAIRHTYIDKFTGKDDTSLIQMRTETKKNAGDRITCGLAVNLTGDGVLEGTPLTGNEEDIQTFDDAFIIGQLRHATTVKGEGTISQQRVPFNLRDLALRQMANWWADRKDEWAAHQLAGNALAAPVLQRTGLQPPIAPDAAHVLRAGGKANDESLAAADTFHLGLIDYAVELATNSQPLIRPLMIGGQPFYVVFAHDYQITDLRIQSTAAGTWYDIQRAALEGGEISGNPIFTGAVGVYNQTIIHKWSRLPQGVNSGTGVPVDDTRRAVFCGSQAAWIGYGQNYGPSRFKWVESLFDYEENLGVGVGCLGGLKKSVFNAADYATITIPTFARPHDDS